MKKRLKQVLGLLLCMIIVGGMLAGCGSKKEKNDDTSADNTTESQSVTSSTETDKADISKHVDLKMYLLGERTPDFDAVYAKINEILEKKFNCSLSVEFLSWGEHATTYPLLFSSGEDFDLIFTATSWGHYESTVALGGFKPLTEEFIQTYAPDIWKVVPQAAWDQAKINGQTYMVPGYNNEYVQDVMAVRGDLMQKYGFSTISQWDEFKNFAMAAAKDGVYTTQGGMWYPYFWSKGMTITGGAPSNGELVLYNAQNPDDLNLYYILDWDKFTDYCKQSKEMADAGCWSQDVLNNQDDRQTGLLTGKTASMLWNLGTCTMYGKQANAEHPDWNVTLADITSGMPRMVKPYINGGVSINTSSKNAERAMMVLNALYTDRELFDLTYYGIEGKHWKAIGEDQYQVIDESGYGVDANCNWGWRNLNLYRTEFIEKRTPLDDQNEQLKTEWGNNVKTPHIYDGFTFDSTPVSTQMAALGAVLDTYYSPLTNGLVDDVDSTIEEFRKAMDDVGMREILDEMKKQAAAYVSSK